MVLYSAKIAGELPFLPSTFLVAGARHSARGESRRAVDALRGAGSQVRL